VKTLEDMVAKMAEYQLGKTLTTQEVSSIVSFLKALKGDIPKDYIAQPKLPESGPNTPKA
jgi:cytochrome c peroxidase